MYFLAISVTADPWLLGKIGFKNKAGATRLPSATASSVGKPRTIGVDIIPSRPTSSVPPEIGTAGKVPDGTSGTYANTAKH